ncbi:MAG: protein-glutamate O-methyltransferase CheR [Anaerovibrio sp.]|uniref:CheR family methyltransferase n=1 Tax=Anaerovibrio sp. TaxID=1872532 RepID=UPI0025F84068|nr:protein-glutamate O-methyltransferase CheR [Anaerovibrio sp.]MCR5176058.1 protein-glutamate O-methyltransferase CheR [Anaerovibrio sp.]
MKQSVFQQFSALVQQNFGIQLPQEKKALLESRLFKLMNENNTRPELASEEAFLEYIKGDASGCGLAMLAEAITTHHTFFMREADHFDFYAREVLPFLAETIKDGDVRTWCAASSTGEEAYTLAMLLSDYFSPLGPKWETTLLATDLSRDVLEKGKSGVFTLASVKTLPLAWQSNYFIPCGDGNYQVIESLRRKVLFRQFNLMNPVFPFKKPFHVIFCRNVMIYFDAPTRELLVQKFFDFLEPGGFLFIGHSEVIEKRGNNFDYVMPSIYRKKGAFT